MRGRVGELRNRARTSHIALPQCARARMGIQPSKGLLAPRLVQANRRNTHWRRVPLHRDPAHCLLGSRCQSNRIGGTVIVLAYRCISDLSAAEYMPGHLNKQRAAVVQCNLMDNDGSIPLYAGPAPGNSVICCAEFLLEFSGPGGFVDALASSEKSPAWGLFSVLAERVGYVRLIPEPHPPRCALRASLRLSKFDPVELVDCVGRMP